MKTTTFSQLRNNAKHFFDAVEEGESIEVYRHGKPIAIISPASAPQEKKGQKGWRKVVPYRIPGVSLSQAIIDERRRQR